MTRIRLPLCTVLLLGCTTSPNFDPTEHAAALTDARLRMQAGEVDEALIITDRLLLEYPDNREARLLAAEGSFALSALGRTNTAELIADGIRHYQWALELNGEDAATWLALARGYLMNAEFQDGVGAALQAAALLRAEEASAARIAEAVIVAADNEMQIFVEARNEEFASPDELDPNGNPIPSPGTLERAAAVFSRLDYAKQAAPGAAYSKSALVYQWLGQYSNALSELERGLDAAANEVGLHIDYQDLHLQLDRRSELVASYRRLAREKSGVSLVQFYLGRAHVLLGDRYREQGDWEQAGRSYEAGRQSFGQYRNLEFRNREATDIWLAICNLSLGRMDYEMGNLDRAVDHYVAAYENDPEVTEFTEDGFPLIYDAFGGNYISGLDMVARARGVGNGADALAERLAQYEWIIERHPDDFGNIYNNAGFLARDLGMAIELRGNRPGATDTERTGAITEAMALWEKSYVYYVKAVELSPMDPRIVNDCGVMLVYHLKRDYDRARELFDQTIEIGQPMIDSLTDATSQEEREFLEEAVGDAYQNIAVMMHDLGRPFGEYRNDLEQAITYFPYQRREAAAMLRNDGRRPQGARGTVTALGGNVTQDAQDPRKAAFDRVIVETSVKADTGDLDGALLLLDEVTREMTGYAPFHYYLGLYSFHYGNQARDAGGSLIQIEGLYADATRHLQRSVDLDSIPVAPRLALSQAYYETGDFAAAARESESLLRAMQASGESDPETLAACQMVTAQACSRVFIDSKQAGGEDPQNLLAARNAFRSLEAAGTLDESLAQAWSAMEQWAGANAEALAVIGRATKRYPDSGELHQRIIDLGSSGGLGQNAIDFLKNRRDAFGLWYLGRARFAFAEQQWMGSRLDEAADELDTAAENFRACMAANPAYADSSEQWVALCLGKKGVVLMAQDIAAAEKALLEAAALRPDRIEASLGGVNTVKRSLMIVGDRYYQADDLSNAQRLFGEASKAVPQDVDFANNHGLFARDYGTELEEDDKDAEAKTMFEASYQAYTLASSLEPDSVRLLNDRALMLVHHLKRDWDIALQCLEQGIELGEKQWQTPPEDADEREVLEEAIGDCYENLGLYHLEHTNDLDKAEANYKKAQTFYPKERRPGSRRGLRQVEARRKIRN